MGGPRRRGSLSKRLVFRVFAVAIGVLPLLAVETGLRLFGVGNPHRHHDPLVGFSQLHPLFELDAADGVYRTSRSRELFFGVQQFDAVKSDKEFRIFCLGGSTVRGHPYETDTAFARWLEIELTACDPHSIHTVVNCGGISYASYRLRIVLDEVLKYQPDLIVLATGHNEFLEDRTYSQLKHRPRLWSAVEDAASSLRTVTLARHWLRGGPSAADAPVGRTVLSDTVQTKLDDATGYASYHRDDDWHRAVVHHFDRSVRSMVQACQAAEVPLLLVNLGANLRGTPPFKSEHAAGLDPQDQLRWRRLFDDASEIDAADPEQALQLYKQAAEIDDQYALLSFRIARCLDRLGRHQSAQRLYCKAKDEDICPLRMLDSMYLLQQEIAGGSGTPLVDARRLIESFSDHGIAGDDWYTDHVHPTIDGHQRIAQQIVDAMRQQGWLKSPSLWDPRQRRRAYQDHLQQLGRGYLFNGRERVGWLEKWARAHRLYHEALPIDARGNLHRGFRRFGFGETDAAWDDFQVALRDDPALAAELLRFALRLMQQGQPQEARDVVDRLALHPSAQAIEPQIVVAALVLAVEQDDYAAVRQWLAQHGPLPSRQSLATNAWLAAAPDALDQAAGLAARGAPLP